MPNPKERQFEFRILSERSDRTRVIDETIDGQPVRLVISLDDWKRLGESAGCFPTSRQSCSKIVRSQCRA